jgi:NTP pyrophosphatase (non-canonical NTP hydrolase)
MTEAEKTQERVSKAVLGAVSKWGSGSQWRLIQEECAELIVKINHVDRLRADVQDLAEEVADVIICCAQARVMLGERLVDAAVLKKLERLEQRLGL